MTRSNVGQKENMQSTQQIESSPNSKPSSNRLGMDVEAILEHRRLAFEGLSKQRKISQEEAHAQYLRLNGSRRKSR